MEEAVEIKGKIITEKDQDEVEILFHRNQKMMF